MNDIELLERRIAELEERLASGGPYEPGAQVLVVVTIESGPDSDGDYQVQSLWYKGSIWVKPSQIRGRA